MTDGGDRYYVITCGDGGIHVREMTETELHAALRLRPDGPTDWYNDFGHVPITFAESFPSDLEYFNGVLIVRGRVVVPTDVY